MGPEAVSPDGKLLARGQGGGVEVLNTSNQQRRFMIGVNGFVTAIDFSPDSLLLAIGYGSGQTDGFVSIVNLEGLLPTPVRTLAIGKFISRVRFGANGQLEVAAMGGTYVSTGELIQSVIPPNSPKGLTAVQQ